MLISTAQSAEDNNKKAGANGKMSQNGRRDAQVFKTEYQDGNHNESAAHPEKTAQEANAASHKNKEQKIDQGHT